MMNISKFFKKSGMSLRKRPCPIRFSISIEVGWIEIDADFGDGKTWHFPISAIFSDFSDLLTVLYHFSWNEDEHDIEYGINEERINVEYDDVHGHLSSAIIKFDEEGSWTEWNLTAKDASSNPVIEVSIDFYRGDSVENATYDCRWLDLCYAAADAYTKVLKAYGFYGYHCSADGFVFPMHQFLAVKYFALHDHGKRETHVVQGTDYGRGSSLEEELELTLFDMS